MVSAKPCTSTLYYLIPCDLLFTKNKRNLHDMSQTYNDLISAVVISNWFHAKHMKQCANLATFPNQTIVQQLAPNDTDAVQNQGTLFSETQSLAEDKPFEGLSSEQVILQKGTVLLLETRSLYSTSQTTTTRVTHANRENPMSNISLEHETNASVFFERGTHTFLTVRTHSHTHTHAHTHTHTPSFTFIAD